LSGILEKKLGVEAPSAAKPGCDNE
jgi:hypothetical protein